MKNAKAYILIEVAAGYVLKVLKELKSIDQVNFAHAITGQYDIIAEVEAEDMAAIGRISLNRVQKVEGVIRTVTCNVVEF